MTDVWMRDNQKIRLCMGCIRWYDSQFVALLTVSAIGSFIGTAIMLALNVIYFRNRKEIFVN